LITAAWTRHKQFFFVGSASRLCGDEDAFLWALLSIPASSTLQHWIIRGGAADMKRACGAERENAASHPVGSCMSFALRSLAPTLDKSSGPYSAIVDSFCAKAPIDR